MSITLRSKNYLHGMKWLIKPRDVVDTVNMRLSYGAPSNRVVDVHDITSGLIDGHAGTSLPLDNNYEGFAYRHIMQNVDAQTLYGIANVELSRIQGSYEIELQIPLLSSPYVVITLEGNTTYITRGQKTPEEIYEAQQANLYQFIDENARNTEVISSNKSYDKTQRGNLKEGLLIDYNAFEIPLYPFIRKTVIPWTGSWANYINASLPEEYRVKEEDLFCRWDNYTPTGVTGGSFPPYSTWISYATPTPIRQGPPLVSGSIETPLDNNNRFLPIRAETYRPAYSITKIDDLHYRVNYDLPVRYMQAVAAQSRLNMADGSTRAVYDSYAWKDVISSIKITTYATAVDTTVQDLSYSLDSAGKLTTDTKNVYPLDFAANELITRDVTFGTGVLWSEAMPLYLLTKFQKGKYAISCDVKAAFAIDNNIRVNSEIIMYDIKGEPIKGASGQGTATFQVKNIEKIFKDSEFIYRLQLLEV